MTVRKVKQNDSSVPSTPRPISRQACTGQTPSSNPGQSSAGQGLRKRVEEKAGAMRTENQGAFWSEEDRHLLSELQAHQIELELQNEELRRTQIELNTSRARYFDLYDLAPVGYISLNEKGLITEINLTAANLLGVPRNALVKKWLSHFILPEDQDIYYRHRNQLFKTHEPQAYALRLVDHKGTPFWVHLNSVMTQDAEMGMPVCLITISDIIQRKLADNDRREDNTKFRHLVETASLGIWKLDKNFAITYINDQMAEMLGYSPEEVLGRRVDSFIFPEDLTDYTSKMTERQKGITEQFERRYKRKDGSTLWVLISPKPLCDAEGRFDGSFSMIANITRHKKTEESLRVPEVKYRLLFEHTGTGLIIVEEDTTISLANNEFANLSGFSKEEIEGKKKSMDFAMPEDRERLFQYHHQRRRKNPQTAPKEYESRIVDKYGMER